MTFPKNFLWGVATAAHQIEGGNTHSDWWQWEQQPGRIAGGDTSAVACDHWNRVTEDIELIKGLGCNAYRMSIEWAKIEPEQGKFSESAALHYKDEIEQLKKNGIRPMITLHHFVNPQWFTASGGWARKDAPELFVKYVAFLHGHIGDLVDLWCTLNEPMVLLIGGYVDGRIPPGKTDFKLAEPFRGFLLSHARAYRYLHAEAKKRDRMIQVGIAHHQTIFKGKRWYNPLDAVAAEFADKNFNHAILEALKTGVISLKFPGKLWYSEKLEELVGTQDFVGINYYTRNYMEMNPWNVKRPVDIYFPDLPTSNDLKWEYFPEGLYTVLKRAYDYFPNLPIYITENGTADGTDRIRPQIIPDFLRQVERAIADGINVEGYFHWSLMDNFEWFEGYRPRFGLYEVDYKTQKRTLRKSGEIYKKIISEGKIS